MKRILWIFIVLCSLVGCTRSEIQGEGDSYVTLSAVADPSLNLKSAKASGYNIPVPNDYSYTVRHAGDKSVVAQGASIAGLGTLALMAGNYLFEVASVGEASADKPSYAGSAPFLVKKGTTTKVEVSAKLASSVVEVRFSDAVKSGFSSYKATISAQGVTQTAVFDASTPEGKLLYLPAPATKVTCTIEVTTQQGLPFSTTQTVASLAAADLLSWTVDIPVYEEKPTDPLVLELVLDRTLNEEQKHFTVPLTPSATGVPTITGRLIDLSIPIGVKYAVGSPTKLDLTTKGGLAKVLLMFRAGQEPIAGQSVQGVVDLLALSADERTAWGVAFSEGGTMGATASLLDLSAMTQKMPGSATAAEKFYATIGLLDNNGTYVTREIVFNVYGVSLTTLNFLYADQIDWFGTRGPINRVNVRLEGQYNVDDVPDGLAFQYRRQGETAWQVADPTINTTTKAVYADLPLLADGGLWEYRLSSADENGATVQIPTLPSYPVLADMDFEKMLTGKVDQERWNPVVTPWGYSNPGTVIIVSVPDNVTKDISYDGSTCPKIQSAEAVGQFASGGLFSGYIDVDMNNPFKSSKVGLPFVGRPKQLKGMYKYVGKPIGNYQNGTLAGNDAVSGGSDHFEIAIKLEKWGGADNNYMTRWRDGFYGEVGGSSYPAGKTGRNATELREKISVGYGQLLDSKNTDWKEFVIDIAYFKDELPDHLIITAVSSAWGGYMTGGLGSTLWVDNLELIY